MAAKESSPHFSEVWDAACQLLEDASHFSEPSIAGGKRLLYSPDYLFSICESLLSNTKFDYSTQVYMHIAELSAANIDKDRIWNWLQQRAATTQDKLEREAMCIICFEPVPEEPVEFCDLERLFLFLQESPASWAVFCAYENEDFPQNVCEGFEFVSTNSRGFRVTREQFEQMLKSYQAENDVG